MDNGNSRKRKRVERVYSPSAHGRAAPLKRGVLKKQKRLDKLLDCPTPERNLEAIGKLRLSLSESQNKLEAELAKKPAAVKTPDLPPEPRITRSSRANILSCCHYGEHRYQMFGPSADFCEPCRQWDLLPPDQKSRRDRNSARNQCKSYHTHFIIPTKKKCSVQSPKQQRKKRKAPLDESVAADGSPEEFDSMLELLGEDKQQGIPDTKGSSDDEYAVVVDDHQEIKTNTIPLCSSQDSVTSVEYLQLKHKHEKLLRQIRDAKRQTPAQLVTKLLDSMDKLSIGQQTRAARKASKIILSPVHSPILSSEVKSQVKNEHRKEMKETLFPAEDILKHMDLEGGGMFLNGIEILRRVENKDGARYHHGFLPSSSGIKRKQSVVEAFARSKAPYKKYKLPTEHGGGEAIKFEVPDVLPLVVRGFGLEEQAKTRSVMIAQSIDGARLTNKIGHITHGIKMIDQAAVCPITKKNRIDGNGNSYFRAQSRNNCIPIMTVFATENKAVYSVFEEPMKLFLDELNNESDESVLLPGAKPLNVVLNVDMSAAWKILGCGSGRGKAVRPCHCCSTPGEAWDTPNPVTCSKFCAQWATEQQQDLPAGWLCYHQDFLTEGRLAELSGELATAKNAINDLTVSVDDIRSQSEITYDHHDPRHPSGNAINDPTSIYYDFSSLASSATTNEEKRVAREAVIAYARRIHNDLSKRNMDVTGRLSERVLRLKTRLIQEFTVKKLQEDIEHGKIGKDTALFVLLNTIPCILHMENRIGIKIFSVLLNVGLKRALSDDSMYATASGNKERIENFLGDVNAICNTKILGTQESPSQWKCPFEKTTEEIGTITMENGKIRTVIENFSRLIQLCVGPDSIKRQEWHLCIHHYKKAMSKLRQKEDFSDEGIVSFQYEADRFFQLWVTLNDGISVSGVTNYIHLLGSGHIAQYLFHWRNLYRHSQQGWEALNSMIKVYFFRRTQRGGGRGKRSKLDAIARWFSRRLMWIAGYTYAEMEAYVDEHPELLKAVTVDEGNSSSDTEEEESDYEDEEEMWLAGL